MNTDLLVWATKQTGWCSPSSDCDGVHLRMNCPCADPGRFNTLWGPLNNSSETLRHHQRREHASNIFIYTFRPSEGTPQDDKTPAKWLHSVWHVQKPLDKTNGHVIDTRGTKYTFTFSKCKWNTVLCSCRLIAPVYCTGGPQSCCLLLTWSLLPLCWWWFPVCDQQGCRAVLC